MGSPTLSRSCRNPASNLTTLSPVWRDKEVGPEPNRWTWFRRVFVWSPKQNPHIWFAADPTARLLINGSVVLPRVMRFVSPHITVERLDLSEYLVAGKNVALVLHHFWGVRTFQRSPGGQPGFAVESSFLQTGSDWKWIEAPEFLAHPHQTIGAATQRIRFPVVIDTRREIADAHKPEFDDRLWRAVVSVKSSAWSRPALKETAKLERKGHFPQRLEAAGYLKLPKESGAACPAAPMSWLAKNAVYLRNDGAVRHPEALWEIGVPTAELSRQNGYLTADFGRPLHGYLRIEIEDAAPGTVLDFLCGELRWNIHSNAPVLLPDGSFDPELIVGTPCGDRIILRGGPQIVEIPEERTLRWLLLVWSSARLPVRLKSILLMSSQHPAPERGAFAGGPPQVSTLVRLCLDHARVTMSDTYVDTPGREDAQWLEDIQYRARLAAHWFGDTALRQVTLRHAAEQQAPGGRFRVFAPEDYGEQGLQSLDWGMAWIGMLHDDWIWTGESDRLKRYFSHLINFLDAALRQLNAEGILVDRTCFSDIRCAERPRFDDGEQESIPNAWLYGFLLQAARLADVIGRTKEAHIWRLHARRLKGQFSRFLAPCPAGYRVAEVWSPIRGLIGFGQSATVSAVYHGVVDKKLGRSLLEYAFRKPDGSPPRGMNRWNNPTYFYRALRVLSDQGLGVVAGRHFLERFAPYLPDGPLPEYFIPAGGQPEDPTGSHGWAAVPLLWLHDTVLGVRIDHAGGDILRWKPVNVGWEKIEGVTETPLGSCRVVIDWKRKKFLIEPPKGVRVIRQTPS